MDNPKLNVVKDIPINRFVKIWMWYILEKVDKEILKLSKLCKHWADHNDSHKENFLKWRNIAKDKGLDKVTEDLDKAIEMLDKCNEYLLAAHNDL